MGKIHSLGSDAVKHRPIRLPDCRGVPPERVPQGRANGAGAREETVRGGVRAVLVRDKEAAPLVLREVVERLGELRVVDRNVESADDGPDGRIRRPCRKGEGSERIVLRVL